ncbi:hypothetical protein ABPG74_000413 [Tetrahymena malaccensis]
MNKIIIVKQEQEESVNEQLDYFPLQFNEQNFNQLEDKQEYYLNAYRSVYELIQKKRLKLYVDYPSQDIYRSGVCFALKRQANSALDKIIGNMNGSRFYRCDKGKVAIIGSLAYLDGFLRTNKNLGIRVVRVFSKSQQQLSLEIQNYIDIILVHIYTRDLQEFKNYRQRCIDEDYSKQTRISLQGITQSSTNDNEQIEDESEIDSELYQIPSQDQQKLNQKIGTQYSKEYINQVQIQQIENPFSLKEEKPIYQQQFQFQNNQVDSIGNKQQIPQLQMQKEQVLQNNEQKQDDYTNLKGEQKTDQPDQMQQALFLLYMQNNELQQKLIEKEINQKKTELLILEQRLNKLAQDKELYTKQPQLLNVTQILQQNQKIEEFMNQN